MPERGQLADLHPHWVGHGGAGVRNADGSPVPERDGVGVAFDCPCGCGQHCYIPFANPLDGGPALEPQRYGGTGGWHRTGDTFETLTLTPSIQRLDGCRWHGFITDGEVRDA